MITIVVLAIAVIGASWYRYYSALDARKAATYRTATRIALSLCESWRGQGISGTATYDPVAHLNSELQKEGGSITISGSGPSAPLDFTELGRYEITIEITTDIDQVHYWHYWATLSYKDIATDFRALNIVVAWDERGGANSYSSAMKTFRLTTYLGRRYL